MSLARDFAERLPAVEAELSYLVPMADRPRTYTYEPPSGEPWSNTRHEPHRLPVHDARPSASAFSLDRDGFGLIEQQSAVTDFYDDDQIRRIYYPEAERLLIELTGADRVLVFDHTRRKRIPGVEDRRGGPRQPAVRVHVDHTERSGPQRVRDLLPDEADELLEGRVQIINLWRPIKGPLLDAPLAVCAAGSVDPSELVPSDLVYPDRTGETYNVTYSPAHRWFYFPEMRTDEALLLKCYDSSRDGRARFAPHTGFTDPTTPADAPPRESIELRTLVFHR
ncbi:MAG TPA: CmcJ/NvfI family oxidoreductase [Aliidongia sp.]|nr:CmcJ/NvfI family oxidoreductase [Aliidongia sp.]